MLMNMDSAYRIQEYFQLLPVLLPICHVEYEPDKMNFINVVGVKLESTCNAVFVLKITIYASESSFNSEL